MRFLKVYQIEEKGGVSAMQPDELKELLNEKLMQLEARDRARQQKTKHSKRVQVNPKSNKARLAKSEHSETQFIKLFLSTWHPMYRRRLRRNRVTVPYILPESLFDALLRTFELYIGRLITKLLK
jgi:hypothetical protein